MRIIFAGTPEPAVPSLRTLAESRHEVVAVLTRPDAPIGRKRVLTPSPVKEAATELGIPVIEAERLRGPLLDRLAELQPESFAVVAYGALAGPRALAIAPWLNLHFSLLPDYRGAAPVQHALIDGRAHTGVTVFRLDEGMDTGPVLRRREEPIGEDETAGELLERLARSGAGELVAALDDLAAGTAHPHAQPEAGSHAPKIDSEDARLDLSRPAVDVYARYRGVTPAPGAWALLDGQRAKLPQLRRSAPGAPRLQPGELRSHEGAVLLGTGTEPLELVRIQPPGKRPMAAADFLRGAPDARLDAEAARA